MADFDGDGHADLLWRRASTGALVLQRAIERKITSRQELYREPEFDWQLAGVGDLNGDGRADIVWRNRLTGRVWLQLLADRGRGFSYEGVIYQEPDLAWNIAGLGDFDGDSFCDLLWWNASNGKTWIQRMNGPTILEQGPILREDGSSFDEPNTHWRIVATADLNGDARADVLWRNDETGQVWLQHLEGRSILAAGLVYEEPDTNWTIVGAGDLTNEGRHQIAWENVRRSPPHRWVQDIEDFTVVNGRSLALGAGERVLAMRDRTTVLGSASDVVLERWVSGAPIGLSVPSLDRTVRVGVASVDITPVRWPVIVSGGIDPQIHGGLFSASHPLTARALVMEEAGPGVSEGQAIAMVAVDSLILPATLLDDVKGTVSSMTGLSVDRILISATHTHSAPAAMPALGTPADATYSDALRGWLVDVLVAAANDLRTGEIGWSIEEDFEHTHNRRWIQYPNLLTPDPFSAMTVKANMHPAIFEAQVGPSGPVNPDLSVLAVREASTQRALGLFANYSMHYHSEATRLEGAAPDQDLYGVGPDYFGRFSAFVSAALSDEQAPGFVASMSQGTSGDLHLYDYAKPEPRGTPGLDQYAAEMTARAVDGYRNLAWRSWVSLDAAFATLPLARRVPDAARVMWAKSCDQSGAGCAPSLSGNYCESLNPDWCLYPSTRYRPGPGSASTYAKLQLELVADPAANVRLQAMRVGELGVAAIGAEVFALSGLRIKGESPLPDTFTIEHANGADGYIPPPEQHALGGYTTFAAPTAGLEVGAEPAIVTRVGALLAEVAGAPGHAMPTPENGYAAVVAAHAPLAHWPLAEATGTSALDVSGRHMDGTFEDPGADFRHSGYALYLPGPMGRVPGVDGSMVDSRGESRAVHFAGGRMSAIVEELPADGYSVAFWFWSGLLANDRRPVTGYLFSRGDGGAPGVPGDHVGIAGSYGGGADAGRLFVYNGDAAGQTFVASSAVIQPWRWYHLVFVRQGSEVRLFLNGAAIGAGSLPLSDGSSHSVFFGARSDRFSGFSGRMSEAAVFGALLAEGEACALYRAAFRSPDGVACGG
ncbi:MAG: VCBS repeat-containing protein [Deltaproteobacteria bacterium]|nr:VCBS repeat-containing protein [Deltaproteobacteria bacterium]